MALSSPNTIGSLTGLEDAVSRQLSLGTFASIADADQQAVLEDEIELALDDIAAEADWTWLRRDATLITTNDYGDGTADVVNGSTTVSGTGTLWNTGTNVVADQAHIVLGDDSGMYKVVSVTNDTTLEITPAYGGTTATLLDYTVVHDEYILADGMWWLRFMREIRSPQEMRTIHEAEWIRETNGGQFRSGRPEQIVILNADTSGSGVTGTNQRIRLWPAPDDTYTFEYSFRSVPTFPVNNFEAQPQGMAMVVYRTLQMEYARRGETQQALYYRGEYNRALERFKRLDVQRAGDVRHRMVPNFSAGRRLPPEFFTHLPDRIVGA